MTLPYETIFSRTRGRISDMKELSLDENDLNETWTERLHISYLANATLTPFMDVVSKKLNEIPKEDLDKVVEFAKNGGFKEV